MSGNASSGSPPAASLASALWYFWNFVNVQLFLLPTLLLLIGLVFCLGRRGFAARNAYPILSFIGIYAGFTLLGTRQIDFNPLIKSKDPRKITVFVYQKTLATK